MADSPTYGWSLPAPGAHSWSPTIDSVFQGIDAAVYSLGAQPARPRVTLILSYHATGDGVEFPKGIGDFRIMSAAPYGAFVGSFDVVHSGVLVFFDLQMLATCSGFFGPAFSPVPDFRLRLVVNPGSLMLPDPTTGFLYRPFGSHTSRAWPATGWAVASLGVGEFSVGIDQYTVNCAQFGLHGRAGYCQLLVYEG